METAATPQRHRQNVVSLRIAAPERHRDLHGGAKALDAVSAFSVFFAKVTLKITTGIGDRDDFDAHLEDTERNRYAPLKSNGAQSGQYIWTTGAAFRKKGKPHAGFLYPVEILSRHLWPDPARNVVVEGHQVGLSFGTEVNLMRHAGRLSTDAGDASAGA